MAPAIELTAVDELKAVTAADAAASVGKVAVIRTVLGSGTATTTASGDDGNTLETAFWMPVEFSQVSASSLASGKSIEA